MRGHPGRRRVREENADTSRLGTLNAAYLDGAELSDEEQAERMRLSAEFKARRIAAGARDELSLTPAEAEQLEAHQRANQHHADLRHAMGHTARDTAPKPGGPQDIDAIHKVVTMLITAEPALDIDCFPIDPATGRRQLEGEGGLEMAARLLRLAHERGAFDAGGSPTTRHWRNTALYLWHCLAEIERLDPSDTELSKVQFRGEVRRLAAKRLDMFSAETYAKLDAIAPEKSE